MVVEDKSAKRKRWFNGGGNGESVWELTYDRSIDWSLLLFLLAHVQVGLKFEERNKLQPGRCATMSCRSGTHPLSTAPNCFQPTDRGIESLASSASLLKPTNQLYSLTYKKNELRYPLSSFSFPLLFLFYFSFFLSFRNLCRLVDFTRYLRTPSHLFGPLASPLRKTIGTRKERYSKCIGVSKGTRKPCRMDRMAGSLVRTLVPWAPTAPGILRFPRWRCRSGDSHASDHGLLLTFALRFL